nr:Asp23/Gls24 family envelope stress response protein [Micromonospora sp. DSM 115978]
MTTTTNTQNATQEKAAGSSAGRPSRDVARQDRHSSELTTDQGRTSIADSVVQKIAGIATREVSGVHDLGTGGKRAVGTFRSRIPGTSGPSASQGVSVEVGERQAAVDLDVVCDYGVSIVDLSHAIRRNVVTSVEGMTGLEVTEVNIAVDDVYVAGEEDDDRDRDRDADRGRVQ